jgi:hypothetical protein
LIPILSIPSGTVNVNNQVEIYSTNPDIAPPRLNFDGANVISGLPDR